MQQVIHRALRPRGQMVSASYLRRDATNGGGVSVGAIVPVALSSQPGMVRVKGQSGREMNVACDRACVLSFCIAQANILLPQLLYTQ